MIPEELLKCSEKELIKILDKKNIFTSKYLSGLGSNSTVYTNGGVSHGRFFFKKIDSNYWDSIDVCNIDSKFNPLSLIRFKEIKKDLRYKTINNWSTAKLFEFVYNKTVDCYGESFVDSNRINNEVTIYFPEITITNSVEQSHVMRDLYLVLRIRQGTVRLDRLYRTTYTLEEFSERYKFSHVASSNLNTYARQFCYGYANPIETMMTSMCSGNVAIFKNINMFLLMIQEYLSWESIEGVPYRSIDSVLNSKCKYEIKNTPSYSKEDVIAIVSSKIGNLEYSYNLNDNNTYNVSLNKNTIVSIKKY